MMAEEKLIEEVRGHKELYDTKHPSYTKTKLKNRIWQNIATELNLEEGKEAKTMWLKLRNCYRDARRRQIKHIKSGAAPETIKHWRFQKQMTFLESFMSAGLREGNLIESDDHSVNSQNSSELPERNDNLEGNNSFQTDEQSNNDVFDKDQIDEFSSKTTGTLAQTSVAYSKQSKLRMQDDFHSLIRRSLQRRDERPKEQEEERRKLESRDSPSGDPLYNFFISMYQLTKKMPPQYQHRVRSQLFQAVSIAEEEIMNIPSLPATYGYSGASSPCSYARSDSQTDCKKTKNNL